MCIEFSCVVRVAVLGVCSAFTPAFSHILVRRVFELEYRWYSSLCDIYYVDAQPSQNEARAHVFFYLENQVPGLPAVQNLGSSKYIV